MTLLNEDIKRQVSEYFLKLESPVQLLFFGSAGNCDYCDDTLQLIKEVTEVSDKLDLQVFDLDVDSEIAQKYHVDKAPSIVLLGNHGDGFEDYGVRFLGIPAGHEFSSLIQGLVLVSGGDSQLSQATREALGKLSSPILLQVFVTPSCPYCTRSVVLAHQMALESPYIQAEMIEATEFPDLAERQNVSGVPQTTINDGAGVVVGAVPEEYLLAEILRTININ